MRIERTIQNFTRVRGSAQTRRTRPLGLFRLFATSEESHPPARSFRFQTFTSSPKFNLSAQSRNLKLTFHNPKHCNCRNPLLARSYKVDPRIAETFDAHLVGPRTARTTRCSTKTQRVYQKYFISIVKLQEQVKDR